MKRLVQAAVLTICLTAAGICAAGKIGVYAAVNGCTSEAYQILASCPAANEEG